MKYAKWEVRPGPAEPLAGVPPLVGRVLSARGMDAREAQEFLRTDPGLLGDPMGLRDMDKAAARLEAALAGGEVIAIYGDYDVDGVTSTCLLYDFLSSRGGKLLWYVPRRLEDGYGLNRGGLELLKSQGAQVVVTVDCGITAVEEVEYAKALGLDVIVTDHHACKDVLPNAVAVVNPQRPDCPYLFKGLAGVGVALKLAMAMGCPLERYADLAALGTVADVMPLVGENRAIVAQGLRAMDPPSRPGLAALVEAVALRGKVTSGALGFALAPRLNAAGRLGVTRVAVELLLSPDVETARPLAQELCELNRTRQGLEAEIFQVCAAQVEREMGEDRALVVSGSGWHQGVVGIVASRLAERFGRPAFVISVEGGMGKGSCRGCGNLSVFRALESCGELLHEFGGHAMAAGFTVAEENIPALRAGLNRWMEAQGPREETTLEVDCVLEDASLLTPEEVSALELLEPLGAGNPKPVFCLPRCTLLSMGRVGQEEKHMRFRVQALDRRLPAIFFSCPKEWDFRPEERVSVAFSPQINDYRGERSVQLVACDVRPAPTRAQADRAVYQKYRRGEPLSPPEARCILPEREEFVALWRYIAAAAPLRMESATVLSRQVGRALGSQESPGRVMVGLEVFEERGLVELELDRERVSLTLRPREGKVDLEASPILRRLRSWAEGRAMEREAR